jgi:integrase
MPWIDDWEGGRVWRGKDGRKTYFIRRRVAGKLYEVSTRCHAASSALEHLKRFEADPDGYDPTSAAGGEAIVLDKELIEKFLAWSKHEKDNTEDWVRKQKRFLRWWADKLELRDLRRVDLASHVIPALDGATSRKHRIEALKALYGWLRKVRHILKPSEDPTLDALAVPQSRPEQWTRSKVIPLADHEAAVAHLAPIHRDRLTVLAGTGWHTTELLRFAAGGLVSSLPPHASRDHGAVALLECPRRKSGHFMRTAVTEEVAAAARRVLAHGSYSDPKFREAIVSACKAAGIKPFSPGRYRHTVATWAEEAGAAPEAVAAHLWHASQDTTDRFYATHAVRPKVPTPK